uniref:Uncharacterized protein n=1 Tax=Macaca mulatta TaxID=9544 RepID=A0A5F7ZDP3_MACMU
PPLARRLRPPEAPPAPRPCPRPGAARAAWESAVQQRSRAREVRGARRGCWYLRPPGGRLLWFVTSGQDGHPLQNEDLSCRCCWLRFWVWSEKSNLYCLKPTICSDQDNYCVTVSTSAGIGECQASDHALLPWPSPWPRPGLSRGHCCLPAAVCLSPDSLISHAGNLVTFGHSLSKTCSPACPPPRRHQCWCGFMGISCCQSFLCNFSAADGGAAGKRYPAGRRAAAEPAAGPAAVRPLTAQTLSPDPPAQEGKPQPFLDPTGYGSP